MQGTGLYMFPKEALHEFASLDSKRGEGAGENKKGDELPTLFSWKVEEDVEKKLLSDERWGLGDDKRLWGGLMGKNLSAFMSGDIAVISSETGDKVGVLSI